MACEVPPVPNMPGLLGRTIPDNIYGTLTHTYIPSELGRVLPATENYVTHFPVTAKGSKYFICVTDTKIYLVSDTLSKKRDSWDLKEIHSIVGTEDNITINILSKVASDDVHIKPKVFEGDTFFCQALPFVFSNRSRIVWQQLLESKLIAEPEIYQCHFFVAYQEAKKKTGACIVFSDLNMYVCTLKNNLPAAVKEKISPEKFTGLSTILGNDRALKITMGDVNVICITTNAEECNSLGYEIRRLIWDNKRTSLTIKQPQQPQ